MEGAGPVAQEVIEPSRPGMPTGLLRQVALVTGASQGIGRAGDVDELSRSIRQVRRRAIAIEADVSSRTEVARMVELAVGEFGRLDILVNNAGISPEHPIESTTEEVWDRVLAVNLKAQFLLCQAVVPHMRAQGYGRIINIASEQGLVGAVGMSAYCASKAGVFGHTKALARELADDGILVNCIAPGPVDTTLLADRDRTPELASRIPLGRIGRPDEIAFAVLFLASPQTSWTTGQIHSPNGGVVMQ